ncbi:tryptophan synthase subunit alpha [Candidatus Woesearchaeota archaeon]|nr:tryptophan synthase subunit alpha [Candidatus Woesearchaeota archaeon]
MKSYNEVFEKLKRNNEGALITFTVIGDPNYKTSLEIIKKIVDAGADILELGLPFSDPIADGPTIQAADVRALNNGMNTDKVFEFIKEIRNYTDIPIGLLSYFNLVYQRGIEKFYKDAKNAGVNGILIADMPIEESNKIITEAKNNKIETVFMISPLTNNYRIKRIAENATGFVYVVSRLGVTGAKSSLEKSILSLIKRIRHFTNNPLCVGFGVSKPEHVKSVIKAGSDGAIVGSAIVDLIAKNINSKDKMLSKIYYYVKGMKEATQLMNRK